MNDKKLIRTILNNIFCTDEYCDNGKKMCNYFNARRGLCELFQVAMAMRVRNKQCKDLIGEVKK